MIEKLDIEHLHTEIAWGTPVVIEVAQKLNEVIEELNRREENKQ